VCWFETVVFGWRIIVVVVHTPLSHTIHTTPKPARVPSLCAPKPQP
jgi:hypothetical protein